MDQKQLTMTDFLIGQPLPWDVYADGDKLLLSRGQIIQSKQQLEVLLERGLYIDRGAAERAEQAKARNERPVPKKAEIRSGLNLINMVHKRLERLLYNFANEPDAQDKILEVAKVITNAVDINSDIALASILLNQNAANYAVRHCVDTAIVALVVARAMKKTPDEINTIMAAALTMNVGMLHQLEVKQEPLTEKETEIIRNHPQESVNLLRKAGITQAEWLSYVLLHHENEDGSGYPGQKGGTDIPQNARILAMADRYCAAVVHRKYRKTLMPNASMRDVLLAGGKPSDPMLAAYFIKELGTYPPGAFIGPRNAGLSIPLQRDTGKKAFAIREPVSSEQITLRFSMQQLWGEQAAP
jgi:HD-GYP domain-containing protein (c-di-GMP phosphodiesterase class II)